MEARGSLNPSERAEYGFALLAYLIANKMTIVLPSGKGQVKASGRMKKKDGGNFNMRDFMPHADPEDDTDSELTIDKFMSVLKPRKD